jgi:hypothetical protein
MPPRPSRIASPPSVGAEVDAVWDAHRNLAPVSTRMLIILALVCGLVILAAFAAQIWLAT